MMNNWSGINNPAMGNVWNRPGMQQAPRYEAPMLHGQQEANLFPMGANSEIYLPDADKDIIWWIRTDNLGNRTVVPWDVSLHKEPEPVDMNALIERINSLEEKVNAKYNKSNAKRPAAETIPAVVE